MKKRSVFICVFFCVAGGVLFARDAVLSGFIRKLNVALVADSKSPVLPGLADLEDYGFFDKDNYPPEEYFAVDRLNDITSVYVTYASYITEYEDEFVFFHNNLIWYMSDVLNHYKDNENSDLVQMLTGMTTVLKGSIQVFSASDDLRTENRRVIAENTYEVISEWWPVFTKPMQAQLFLEAVKSSEKETDEEIRKILDNMLELMKL
ncbi:hypothetical protein [Breznakiella homolactica]|uniref:Uncharacterized protein n=1 Tax=Breznakiella homolactica TaxID=2798577 RepID=A0A7T7XP82_9SPIR|nr:hypothetical protein [Breznakiella homolactica]QQO09862.1 hypothetical protein JFL75_02835 [Breznakiella homolactica]